MFRTENIKAAIKICMYTFERVFIHKESFEQAIGYTDELTGMLNEKAYRKNIGKIKKGFCIILLDVDKFKQYNDTYGHNYGDKILKRIARILTKTMPDKVIPHRLHGDEFLIVCRDLESAKRASKLVRKNTRKTDKITVSQGICQIKESVDEAFEKADQALYESKRQGRNRITVYNEQCMMAV